jgi:hypothetical protein
LLTVVTCLPIALWFSLVTGNVAATIVTSAIAWPLAYCSGYIVLRCTSHLVAADLHSVRYVPCSPLSRPALIRHHALVPRDPFVTRVAERIPWLWGLACATAIVSHPRFDAVLVPWLSGPEKETVDHGSSPEVLR